MFHLSISPGERKAIARLMTAVLIASIIIPFGQESAFLKQFASITVPKLFAENATCTAKLRIHATTIRNKGKGNVAPYFTLADGSQVTEVDLTSNGNFIIDGSADREASGVPIERGDGFVRFLFWGGFENGERNAEISAGTFTLENAVFTGIENEHPHPIDAGFGNGTNSDPETWPLGEGGFDSEVYVTDGNPEARWVIRVAPDGDFFKLRYRIDCPQADLQVGKQGPPSVTLSETQPTNITYMVTVQNNGPSNAGGVTIT
ncbi:MAG: hypothetical protein AAB853_01245, partial [Patescibacteria group bacterium]